MINVTLLREIFQELYTPMVEAAHGEQGTRALRELMGFLQAFYKHVSPESRTSRNLALKHLGGVTLGPLAGSQECPSLEHMPRFSSDQIVVQLLENGRLLISQTAVVDPVDASQVCVVYTYENRSEKFYAKAQVREVINPGVGYASIFAVPTFDDLGLALLDYRDKLARRTSCQILTRVWSGQRRIIFRAAPESTMRDSLIQFLKNCLRGEVRPEQPATATRPVDIKVTWFMSARLALIEIKWLGKSRKSTGKLTSYSEARARKGAKQLADYLDGNADQAPKQETRGYLVIFDGRRARVKPRTRTISHSDGFKYEHAEIVFTPRYHETRHDFAAPIRMFMEPICD